MPKPMHHTVARAAAWGFVACTVGACFPTFQAALIEPGFRVDAAVIRLADGRNDNLPHGPDYIVSLTPAYGFGRRFEVGLPLAVYSEGRFPWDVWNDVHQQRIFMPYAKLALLEPDSKHHLSVSAQTTMLIPANVGVRYGRDLGGWEPQAGAAYIFSGEDDKFVARYNQPNQLLLAGSVGATFNRPRRPAIEIGVLRNSHGVCDPSCPAGGTPNRRTSYDIFVGFRAAVVK